MISFFPTDPAVGRAIGGYNENLTREALGRMQEAAAITQAELQAKAQQQALKQSYFQSREANALEQQRLNQLGQYQQGQLENNRQETKEQMEFRKAMMGNNATEAAKDRESREKIAMGKAGPNPLEVQDANNLAQSLAGRFNFMLKGLAEAKTADEKKVLDQFNTDMDSWSPLTTNAAWKAKRDKAITEVGERYRTGVQHLMGNLPKDAPIDFDGQQFVPKLLTIPGTTTSTSTNAPSAPAGAAPSGGTADRWAGFFPAPQAQPAPAAVAPSAGPDPNKPITVRRSNGMVETIRAADWPKARELDPGVQFHTPGARMDAPTPAPVVASAPGSYFGSGTSPAASGGNTPGTFRADPSLGVVKQLRALLSSQYGSANIGKNPVSEMFGWTANDIPAITQVVLAAERGQPVKDQYGNVIPLTPEKIEQAKVILYQLAQ